MFLWGAHERRLFTLEIILQAAVVIFSQTLAVKL